MRMFVYSWFDHEVMTETDLDETWKVWYVINSFLYMGTK